MHTLFTLFLAQQNVRAGWKNLGDPSGLHADIHRTAVLPLELKKRKEIWEKKMQPE